MTKMDQVLAITHESRWYQQGCLLHESSMSHVTKS